MVNKNYTHIQLIVDRSGSMRPIADDMNNGITSLLLDQDNYDGKLTVGFSRFDSTVEHLVRPFAAVADLENVTFVQPRGVTALNDAIGETVVVLGEALEMLKETERPAKVIVVIVTDGEENASQEYTLDRVKTMIENQQNEFAWEFIFLGANIDAFKSGGGYGVPNSHSANFDYSGAGVGYITNTVSNLISRSRSGDGSGFTEDEQAKTK